MGVRASHRETQIMIHAEKESGDPKDRLLWALWCDLFSLCLLSLLSVLLSAFRPHATLSYVIAQFFFLFFVISVSPLSSHCPFSTLLSFYALDPLVWSLSKVDFNWFLLFFVTAYWCTHSSTYTYIFTYIFNTHTMKRIHGGIVLVLYLHRDGQPQVTFSACQCLKCEGSQD